MQVLRYVKKEIVAISWEYGDVSLLESGFDQRSKEVSNRKTFGRWERDTVVSS